MFNLWFTFFSSGVWTRTKSKEFHIFISEKSLHLCHFNMWLTLCHDGWRKTLKNNLHFIFFWFQSDSIFSIICTEIYDRVAVFCFFALLCFKSSHDAFIFLFWLRPCVSVGFHMCKTFLVKWNLPPCIYWRNGTILMQWNGHCCPLVLNML